MHTRYRQTCRVCGSEHLSPVVDLGMQYLQGSFVSPGQAMPPLRKLPTQLVRCDVTKDENGCGLLQLAHTFPTEILYSNYWYRSGTNATMRNHLRSIVESCLDLIKTDSPVVVDIGCNDGTLLSNYPNSAVRFGVDPSDIARGIGNGVTVINTPFPSERALSVIPAGGVDIVTSIAMFYDLETPCEFAKAIANVLKPNGLWVLEMSYLPLMLIQNSFDTICHEHLEYYSLAVLEFIAKSAGLRIFKTEINDINGGSIRCYVCHAGNATLGSPEDAALMQRLRTIEFDMELDLDGPYLAFQQKAEEIRDSLQKQLIELRVQGKQVHIYGASTKGNVLLQWCGINRSIVTCAADRNPEKFGAMTLGTEIPIISEEESRAMKPDYYLVLPWHFKKEFLERERETIMSGTKLLFPLPEVEIISSENYDAALTVAVESSTDLLTKLLKR